ncbi:MAG: hypothetical protein E4H38_07200 [Gemmatimonadales bacterium]|nr:MAG: hypothetical protein E4H38_07200 [Gemmatimonadales bacterium]
MSFLLYGATGYSGRLIALEAIARGHRPTLAGRNAATVEALATELDLPWTAVGLDDPDPLADVLRQFPAVLNCAGPFMHTWRPMFEACLAARVHYLDITGEITVFEGLARADRIAREAGISLIPGVGFDVVPTDCLAAHLKQRLPTATSLRLAFRASGGVSHGTALTALEGVGQSGAVRKNGVITPVPPGYRTMEVDFGDGKPRMAVTIPWGDVSTAFHSTGIGNVEVYLAMSPKGIASMRRARYFGFLLRSAPVRWLARAVVDRRPAGPSEAARAAGSTSVWGEVTDAEGRRAAGRIRGPEGYTLTALSAVRAMERTLSGATPGFQTPSRAFGPDFVLDIPGVTREDL